MAKIFGKLIFVPLEKNRPDEALARGLPRKLVDPFPNTHKHKNKYILSGSESELSLYTTINN